MIRGIGNLLFSTCCQTINMGMGFFVEPLEHVITVGKFWQAELTMTYLAPRVSIQNVPVCTFKTSLCVPAPHPHVFTHVDVLSVLTDRFERAHEGFPACVTSHTTPHHTAHTHTPQPQQQPQPHTTTTTTHNNDNDNDTQPACSFIRLNTEKPPMAHRSRHSKD